MPHMEMSGGHSNSVDYSDYRFQQVDLNTLSEAGGNNNVTGFFEFEPLEPVGGLSNNEVAELVYLETHVSIEYEQEDDDQDVGSSTEVRGVVGANLSNTFDSLVANGGQDVKAEISNSADGQASGAQKAENRIFQHFRIEGNPAFDDEVNGPGGGASAPTQVYEKHYRDLTGRGPILDQTDDMSATMRVVTGDTVITEAGSLRLHLIWDVAEVDDAGREFSVPE